MSNDKKNYVWEYTYLRKYPFLLDKDMKRSNTDELNENMNKLGVEGWELVSTIKDNKSENIYFWFKRIKE